MSNLLELIPFIASCLMRHEFKRLYRLYIATFYLQVVVYTKLSKLKKFRNKSIATGVKNERYAFLDLQILSFIQRTKTEITKIK